MEFHEKLQLLRKQKGLTQEALAGHLCVSRAAVSKWESGRGYPSLDSLRDISRFFGVSVDDLLSGEDLLSAAQEETGKNQTRVFALLDASGILLLILPLFAERSEGMIRGVCLLSLTQLPVYLKLLYFLFTLGMTGSGLLHLLSRERKDNARKTRLSLAWTAAGTLLFILSRQVYAAVFLFALCVIKGMLLLRQR